MRHRCFNGLAPGRRSVNPFARWLGIMLMIIGLFILVVCTPFWVWAAILGIFIAVIGFFLWRAEF